MCNGQGMYLSDDPVLLRKKGQSCGACDGTGMYESMEDYEYELRQREQEAWIRDTEWSRG